jgi:alkylation response protein AidB-like acyl-CoA dehydrogenase
MTLTLSGTSLLDSAQQLAPLIREHADYADKNGKLAPEVFDAMMDAGLFSIWTPESLGGVEADPITSLKLNETVAYEDAAAGWYLFVVAVGTGVAGVYLPDAGTDQVFVGDRLPVVVGQGTRPGHAVKVDGGYRVTGAWNFASGSPHATHFIALAIVEGTGEARIFILPADEVTIDPTSWEVLGLKGTGSLDYSIDDKLVPEERSYRAVPETPMRGGPLTKLGLVQTATIGHTGWALGVGRRLLDELSTLMRKKAGRAGANAGSDSLHEQYANAEATLRSARALAFETWAEVWETLTAGEDLTTRQGSLIRLALNNATWSADRVGKFVYTAAGTSALRDGTIQRFYRDLHGGTQHIMSGPAVLRQVGRELAGLAEGQQWIYADLAGGESE